MGRGDILDAIHQCGIMPAVRLNTKPQALTALQGLCAGGIFIAEIAMSMNSASAILAEAIASFGHRMIIGAGTVLDCETAKACIEAGAQFIVSPVLDRGVIEICRSYGIAVFPGAATPTEALEAWKAGADCVKLFPAGNLGGPNYLRSLRAPLPQIRFLPMGGVSLATTTAYISAGAWALGVGSDLIRVDNLDDGDEGVAASARSFLNLVAQARANLAK